MHRPVVGCQRCRHPTPRDRERRAVARVGGGVPVAHVPGTSSFVVELRLGGRQGRHSGLFHRGEPSAFLCGFDRLILSRKLQGARS